MTDWGAMTRDFSTLLRDVRAGIPEVMKGFSATAQAALKSNALDTKTKELLALAIAVATRCDPCIAFHAEAAVKQGATREEDPRDRRAGDLHGGRAERDVCGQGGGSLRPVHIEGCVMRDWLLSGRGVLALVVGLLGASAANAAEPLVRKAWLAAQSGDPHLAVLDLRPAEAYRAGHIPGSVSADYRTTEWAVPGPNGAVRALPPPNRIAATIGALGVGDADTVVIVSGDFASAARVYWTFKVLGHREVSILDGGAQDWTDALETRTATRAPAVFTPHYTSALRAELPEVAYAVAVGDAALVDARPPAQWNGAVRSPVGPGGIFPARCRWTRAWR